MSKESQGNDANFILNSPTFKDAINALELDVEMKMLNTDGTSHELNQKLIITKQVIAMFTREFTRQVEDGQVEAQMREIEDERVIKKMRRDA